MGVILRWHSIPEYLSKLIQRWELACHLHEEVEKDQLKKKMEKEIPHFILLSFSLCLYFFTIHRIEMLAPGILYMRDYLVVDKINAMQQVAVHIVPTVHKMLEVLMEFPKVV